MKVYIKKGESEQIVIHYVMTLIILTIIVLGAFLGISNSNFDLDFDYIFSDIEIFIDFITRYGMSFLTALVFGSIPLFIYGATATTTGSTMWREVSVARALPIQRRDQLHLRLHSDAECW